MPGNPIGILRTLSPRLVDQLLMVINGVWAFFAPLSASSGPSTQLTTIATYLIDLQCEDTQEKP